MGSGALRSSAVFVTAGPAGGSLPGTCHCVPICMFYGGCNLQYLASFQACLMAGEPLYSANGFVPHIHKHSGRHGEADTGKQSCLQNPSFSLNLGQALHHCKCLQGGIGRKHGQPARLAGHAGSQPCQPAGRQLLRPLHALPDRCALTCMRALAICPLECRDCASV